MSAEAWAIIGVGVLLMMAIHDTGARITFQLKNIADRLLDIQRQAGD